MMFLPLGTLLVVYSGLFAIWLTWRVAYNLLLSPLSSIPGPLIAKVTPAWLRLVILAGDRTLTIHRLHERYGSAVRIAPQEVSFSDASSVKELYGQQTTFLKAPVYESMSLPPLGIFSMRDRAEHSQRRRLLSHAFSPSNLHDSEPLIQSHIERLLGIVEIRIGAPLDMLTLFRLTAFDIVGELFLGQSFGGLDAGKTPPFLHDMDLYFILAGLKWDYPWLITLLSLVPVSRLQYFFDSMNRLVQYGQKAFGNYVAQYGRNSGRKDLLTKILTVKTERGETPLTDKETYTEIGNLVFAGTDTTSTTLTFLFWELARNPTWQDRLREELLSKTPSSSDKRPSYIDLQDLPILDAVINEALRLHPAAPASLPRETPAGGKLLNGYLVPEKTIVSMQCYTTQRDPAAFPSPNAFKPERWMEVDGVSNQMKTLFMPFSKGSRACLGKNLAMIELKLITASLVRSYVVETASTTTEDTMAMKDHFLLVPKGGKCELIFTKVPRSACT